jgi:hypothetical protein
MLFNATKENVKESLINEWKIKLKAFQKTNDQLVELVAIHANQTCYNK